MEATKETGKNPAGAQSSAKGATLSGGLAVTEAMVLKAVYESGLHQYAPGVLRTSWKDGIDLDVPCAALMSFSGKICKAANMVYMTQPDGEKVSYGVFRQRSRAELAKRGEVWSGTVRAGRFVPDFESTDVRRGGELNTARVIDR